jgi:hypothetical protein
MKFAVGLPVAPEQDELFLDAVDEQRAHVAELFFAWPGMPSGRAPVGRGERLEVATERVVSLLQQCHGMGLRLDLLLNASCHGAAAVSEALAAQARGILDTLAERGLPVAVVTTMSPFIARAVRESGHRIELRASVNMRVGSLESMAALAPWFDSFYVQRERNRDLAAVREFAVWAANAGKGLAMLANSGCLHGCPVQTFHDNLVSHESEIRGTTPPLAEILLCRSHLRQPGNHAALLQATWVRPEDIHHYDGVVPLMKLATRMSARPDLIIKAYCRGRHSGNLLDLLEPGYSTLAAPWILDNSRFPDDWFMRTSQCDHRCHACTWCATTLARVRTAISSLG